MPAGRPTTAAMGFAVQALEITDRGTVPLSGGLVRYCTIEGVA